MFEWTITTAIACLTLLLMPAIGLLIRLVVKWTQVESRLNELTEDMSTLVRDKDRVHTEIVTQMREDRAATDRRLRWLEEHLWRKNALRSPPGG